MPVFSSKILEQEHALRKINDASNDAIYNDNNNFEDWGNLRPMISNQNNRLAKIQCFLIDMDGTVFLGNRLITGAQRFVDVLRQQGKHFLFLTNNSSKSAVQYAEKITKLGIPLTEKQIFTSGEATALYLQNNTPYTRLFVVGTPELEKEFVRHGFPLVQKDPECVVLGFDTTLTYEKLWALCRYVKQGLPYYATHPDINCPLENSFMPDIGAMIAFVKTSSGREPDGIIGKPNRLIVDSAAAKMGFPLENFVMIGDRLYTDIAMGKTSGVCTVLVLSGESKLADLQGSPFQPDYVFENLGAIADWLLENA
jgi:HAD superfamily hydrolase (TIGR01457 family)